MKKLLLVSLLAIIFTSSTFAQGFLVDPYGLSRPPIYGTSPFQDSLWGFDTTVNNVIYKTGPTPSAGGSFTGTTGLTVHPHTGEIYVVCKQSAVSGRILGKYNVFTGVVTIIGNLGDNFSSISFREDGQLFGVTGDGATTPETLYLIDHTNASKTVAGALGAGADGEVIAYNFDDNFFYHWSGNGTVVYERVLSIPPYTATNIPIIGTTSGETFGAVYLGGNKFRTSSISSAWNYFFTTGAVTAQFGSNPDDIRGLGLVARWVAGTTQEATGVCNDDAVLLTALATNSDGNRHKYQWVKNGVNIPGATSNTLNVTSANGSGRYNCRIIIDSLFTNGQTMDSAITVYTDTAWYGRTIIFNPAANILPTPTAYLCNVGDTTVLVNSGYSGSNQWYMNGVAIVGATNPTLVASAVGLYNVTATLVAGCVDTMSVGTVVMLSPSPTLTNSPDMCFGDSVLLTANSGSSQYNWLLNGSLSTTTTANTIYVGADGNYSVATHFGGCVDTSATAPVDFAPAYDVTPNGSEEICFGTNQTLTAPGGGTSYQWLMNGAPIGGATSSTYNANAAGDYTAIITFPGCSDTANTSLSLTVAPQYTVTPSGSGSVCIGSNQLLTATAGGSSYQWLNNGTPIGGATSATYNATTSGNYSCIITFTDCMDTTVNQYTLTAVDCSGIEETNSTTINLYPNPAHEKLNISASNNVLIEQVDIIDLSGRKVISTTPNSSNTIINVEELRAGAYMITITTEHGVKTKKIIKN